MKSQKVCIVYRSINHVFKKMHQQAKWLIREFQSASKATAPLKILPTKHWQTTLVLKKHY